jgi:hypothetical protein
MLKMMQICKKLFFLLFFLYFENIKKKQGVKIQVMKNIITNGFQTKKVHQTKKVIYIILSIIPLVSMVYHR